ncbi:MAG: phosphatidylglycerophosphatase A [Phycisphaerales bacterium]|nr:phosphatidylglycerophosphatase A [Phycisphaerales bacterium]
MKPHLQIPARPPLLRGVRLITVFGLGLVRPAPGTFGSLPPVFLAWVLFLALPAASAPAAITITMLLVLVVFSLACIMQGDAAEARFRAKDPSSVVADETAGQCIPLLFLPGAALANPTLAAFTLVFAFLCFRAFDIIKPWPANQLQRLPSGWGILIDDLFAGLYAAVLVQVVSRTMLG